MTYKLQHPIRPDHARNDTTALTGTFDFTALLTAEFGDQPGILLDAKGVIVAANPQAAGLLGRTPAALIGTNFGVWAPQSDQTDLDLVRPGSGTTVVRAKRVGLPDDHGYVPVQLREVPPAGEMPLAQAVVLALFDASSDVTGGLRHSVEGALPDLRVGPAARDAVAKTIVTLVELAGLTHPQLKIRFDGRGPGWIELRMAIHLDGSEGRRPLPQRDLPLSFEESTRCSLAFENPEFIATLRLPVDLPN